MNTRHPADVRVTWRLVAATVALLGALLLAACGGGGSSPGEPVAGPPAPVPGTPPTGGTGFYSLTVDANPLKAAVSPDVARSVSTRLRYKVGGTLTAQGADGTVYTLTVPDDALTEDVTITMTPLASLSVTDLSSERQFGVQLGPDGLGFFHPVQLEITPPAGVAAPIDQQIPIGWSGADNVVSLAPLADRTRGLKLSLMHFSGYALLLASKGMGATLAGVEHRFGGSEADRISSALAHEIQTSGSLSGPAVEALMREYADKVVKLRLANAGESCAAARLAMQTLLGFARQLELLGGNADDYLAAPVATTLASLLETGGVQCMKEEFEICRDAHIITRVIPTWLGFERQAQLLGVAEPRPAWLDTVEAYAGKCLRFDLQFSSSVDYDIGSGKEAHLMSERVETTVPIRMMGTVERLALGDAVPPEVDELYIWIHGPQRPLVSRDYQASYVDPCVSVDTVERIGGSATVPFLSFVPGDGSPTEQARVLDFTVGLSMAPATQSRHTATFRSAADGGGCKDPVTETIQENWGTEAWEDLVDMHLVDTTFGSAIRGWTIGSGDILATRDFDFVVGDDSSGRSHVRATAVLFHRPAPD